MILTFLLTISVVYSLSLPYLYCWLHCWSNNEALLLVRLHCWSNNEALLRVSIAGAIMRLCYRSIGRHKGFALVVSIAGAIKNSSIITDSYDFALLGVTSPIVPSASFENSSIVPTNNYISYIYCSIHICIFFIMAIRTFKFFSASIVFVTEFTFITRLTRVCRINFENMNSFVLR